MFEMIERDLGRYMSSILNDSFRSKKIISVCRIVLILVCPFVCFQDLSGQTSPSPNSTINHLNVLFIAIDDLRPALGCYGDPNAKTPNIDRIAKQGMIFNRAYCQQSVCSPSRLSLLTGRRPDTTQVWDLNTHFREALPEVVTLPQHFKNNGYHTQSIGKIFHGGGKPSKDPPSWSKQPKYDKVRDPKLRYALPKNLNGNGLKRAASESAPVSDGVYIDGIVTNAAISTLRELSREKTQGKRVPFFLAVGFRKPHLPFNAPKKYWDLHEREKIPLPKNLQYPQGAPELATRSWRELEGYTDIPKDGKITNEKMRELRHGYYACISYIDSLIGRLYQELVRSKIHGQTVIVLWGDHGFHLGEQGLWTKANNYELSTRVPLIVSVPGIEEPTDNINKKEFQRTDALVELVDLYPTLTDICGLSAPEGVEGISFKPLLTQPELPWKKAVFSQYPRMRKGHRHREHGEIMGYAIRTQKFRYIEWQKWKSKEVIARELYVHDSDPHEMLNVSNQAKYQKLIMDLSTTLQSGWKSVLPP